MRETYGGDIDGIKKMKAILKKSEELYQCPWCHWVFIHRKQKEVLCPQCKGVRVTSHTVIFPDRYCYWLMEVYPERWKGGKEDE